MSSLVDLGKRLLEASKKGEADEVSMLMTSGAPFTTDWLGTSPLHLAAQYGHTRTAEVLLRAGVSRDARTKVDRTPIHLAAQHGHFEIVDLLIAGGASVNHTDMLNMTPLHWACDSGHGEIVKLLLKNGARMDTESKFKQLPIDIARQKGFTDIVEILLQEEASDRSQGQGTKRQSQASLTLGSIKKRQRTRKFPMTAGSWTGVQDSSNGQNVQLLRTHSETMAPLVSAAALASSEEKNSKKTVLKTEASSSQDSSVLDALATLATATLHQTTCIPSAPTNTLAMAMSAVGKQSVTLSPLTIPPNTPSQLLSNITPITPPMWGNVPPLQSPLAALSTISALSQPAQPSPLNIPMHQLPFAVPIGFNSQSGNAAGNQLIITQVPIGSQHNVNTPSAQSTVTVSSITGSAVTSVVDQSSSNEATHSNTQTTAYLVPIMGAGPGGQGHLFLSAPDGTPQLVVDSGHVSQQQSASAETATTEKANIQQPQQDNVFQVQLTPAILQQLSQNSLDIQTPRANVVHSILTQPLHIAGQVSGQLPQIQMALAQVLPNQAEAQTQAPSNTQNTSSQVLIQAVPLATTQQQESQSQPTLPATEATATSHQQLLQQLLQGQASHQVQVTEVAQTTVQTSAQVNSQATLIASQLPASAALQNLLNQNLQGVNNTQTPATSQPQQKVVVDLQKIVETQERELRARRELEERLEQARRDSRKFQTELQQAQKEAESYKDRLQAIKEKDTEDEPAVGGVTPGEQFARHLFIQSGSLEGLGTSNIIPADAVDMLSQVAQESTAVTQVEVDETVVDEGDITCT